MNAKQHLYYALGVLCYAIAKADGEIQIEEQEKLKEIIESKTGHTIDFTYVDIIFRLLEKDGNLTIAAVYDWAMENFELGKHYFADEMKLEFLGLMKQVAHAFPPATDEERELIEKFRQDLPKLGVNVELN